MNQGFTAWASAVCRLYCQRQLIVVEAVLYRYRAGIPWRNLPEQFGDWKNIHRRCSRWSVSGIWEEIFKYLATDADNEYGMIDSTIVRAYQHSAGAIKKTQKMTKRSEKAKGG